MRPLVGKNALCRMWRVWSATEGDLQQIGQIGHFGGHLGLRRSIGVTLSDAEGGEEPRAEPIWVARRPFGVATWAALNRALCLAGSAFRLPGLVAYAPAGDLARDDPYVHIARPACPRPDGGVLLKVADFRLAGHADRAPGH